MAIDKMVYWCNLETGELLTYDEMIEQGKLEYDLDDPSNIFTYHDYYSRTNILVQ